MLPAGSDSPRPLHPVPAVVVTVLGVAAMFASAVLAARLGLGLGLRAQIALGTVLLALPPFLALLARPPARAAALGSAPLTRRAAVLSTVLGAALWVGSLGLMEVQSALSPPTEQYLDTFRALHRALAPSGALDLVVSLAVIAVLPGLCEELVIRGTLLPSLVGPLGPAAAVGASALVFAAMHLDAYRFLFTLAVGLVFGAVRLATASLWPSVLAHVTLNALTFAIAPLVDDPSQPYTPEPVLGLACLAAGIAVGVPVARALRRRPAPPA